MTDRSSAPACSRNPDLWFSDDETDQAKASAICSWCPVKRECGQLGDTEAHGIWGGGKGGEKSATAADIRRMHAAGMDADEIAAWLELPIHRVNATLQRSTGEWPKTRERAERNAQIITLTRAGNSANEIAELLGVTARTVSRARASARGEAA